MNANFLRSNNFQISNQNSVKHFLKLVKFSQIWSILGFSHIKIEFVICTHLEQKEEEKHLDLVQASIKFGQGRLIFRVWP